LPEPSSHRAEFRGAMSLQMAIGRSVAGWIGRRDCLSPSGTCTGRTIIEKGMEAELKGHSFSLRTKAKGGGAVEMVYLVLAGLGIVVTVLRLLNVIMTLINKLISQFNTSVTLWRSLRRKRRRRQRKKDSLPTKSRRPFS